MGGLGRRAGKEGCVPRRFREIVPLWSRRPLVKAPRRPALGKEAGLVRAWRGLRRGLLSRQPGVGIQMPTALFSWGLAWREAWAEEGLVRRAARNARLTSRSMEGAPIRHSSGMERPSVMGMRLVRVGKPGSWKEPWTNGASSDHQAQKRFT